MNVMKIKNLLTYIFLTIIISCTPDSNKDKVEWLQLFNGRDLNGWDIKITGYQLGDNFGETFTVKDSLLTIQYHEYDSFKSRFGHIFYENEFSWYRLRVVYRFIGDQLIDGPGWAFRNSGLMLHGQSAESMGINQDFPASIEVQLLGGNGKDDRTTANLCTPGTNVVFNGELDTRHCISSTSETFHGDQWVEAEVLVYGDSLIEHYIEGDLVLSYTNPQLGGGNVSGHKDGLIIDGQLLNTGTISLQSESHPVQFKTVELLNLKGCMDPKAKNYKSYYLMNDPEACIY